MHIKGYAARRAGASKPAKAIHVSVSNNVIIIKADNSLTFKLTSVFQCDVWRICGNAE